ncbi:TonB-dependent receptor domain-containing protein [Otariodibacter oris]|uniref:Outer membrane receptor for ferrienterochelin and colicins n=1 Tax=Otariodibacter oris TaxID=1032623 RepID=A0A420XGK0_9PAST|nr:TonB-dependent receptor [Otariodibacter oris]QGM80070.1 hypothetical protein A6A10_00920 [Otariodibacter oris]RKR71896.1 outer membrane receptor for ferrienterochelin and colicins [Otariodibacter oris]
MRYSTLSIAIMAGIFTTIANADTSDMATLDDIVVSASGTTQIAKNAPASVSIVQARDIANSPVTNVAEAIKSVPGVNISGSNVNSEDISIRGLSGDYTLMMTNGRRQNTRESRPNGNGGFESGFLPPLAAIQRIEVVRGPMSSLYGSDAMGGVVNVITKPIEDTWNGALSLGGIARQGSNGEQGNSSFFISGPLLGNKLGLQVYGSGNLRQEDAEVSGSNKVKNNDITSKLVFTPNDNHKVEFEVGKTKQEKTATPGLSQELTTNRAGSITRNLKQIVKNDRKHWVLTYFGTSDLFNSELSVYQEKAVRKTWNERLNSYDSRRPEITNTTVDGKLMIPVYNHFIVLGGQYQHAKLEDDSVENLVARRPVFMTKKEKAIQKALFLEDEISFTQDLLLTLGLRMDSHENYGTHWNPRAYLVYHLTPELTMKGGVAKAFRAPTIREISEDYITSTQGGAGVIYGNPDLKPETSWNQEIGIEYSNGQGISGGITLFNTEFKNKLISYQTFGTNGRPRVDDITGANLFVFDNIGKANIRGLELTGKFAILDNLNLALNYTYQRSKRKEEQLQGSRFNYDGYPLTNTPKHQFNSKADWQVTSTINTFIRYNYVGKRVWADQRTGYSGGPARYASAYSTIDLGANYQFGPNVLFNVGILNLTNERGDKVDASTGGNWSPVDSRRYWANVNLSF